MSDSIVKPKNNWLSNVPGIALCLLIAAGAWFLGKLVPVIGGPVIAIISGIIITSLFPAFIKNKLFGKFELSPGVKYASKKLLQYAIILLGFEMNLSRVIQVGGQSLLAILFTLVTAFLVAFLVGKALKLSGDVTTLIGVGTAICGGSAIAATAPIIRAKDEDVARSISTIFLFSIIAIFSFPALGHALGLGDAGFGLWAGTAINDTSSVVAAGTAWSDAAGSDAALQLATIVKLTRTLMIVPITLALAVYMSRKSKQEQGGSFSFAKVFPWFVIFFVLASIVNTFVFAPAGLEALSKTLTQIGKFIIVMALAAVGLNTNIKSFVASGWRPILLGFCCWFSVAAVSFVVQRLLTI